MKPINKLVKEEINKEVDAIDIPPSLYEFAKNIKSESEKSHTSLKKINDSFDKRKRKRYPIAVAIVVGFGIIVTSTFLSPAMAEMKSKIPFLGQLFQSKSIDLLIYEAIEKAGYDRASIGMTPGDKILFEISLEGTKEDADRERKKITTIVDEILKSKGYDQYKIKVSSFIPEITPLSEEEKKLADLGQVIEKNLRSSGYDIITVNPYNEKIDINIPLTETRENEISKITLDIAKDNGLDKTVSFTKVDVENNKREGIWLDYLRTIHEGLSLNKEFHVSSYGYSYRPEKMKIIIKTTMKLNDKDAEATVKKIESEIVSFLETDDVQAKVKNQPYELIIRSKGGEEFSF